VPEPAPVYFLILAFVGLIGAGMTAVRVRQGKPGSPALPVAFLAFTALGFAIYFGASDTVRNVLIGFLAAALVVDVVLKAGKRKT